jgi:hypothetical protein
MGSVLSRRDVLATLGKSGAALAAVRIAIARGKACP